MIENNYILLELNGMIKYSYSVNPLMVVLELDGNLTYYLEALLAFAHDC